MNSPYISTTILSFLEEKEIYPKYLLINKRYNIFLKTDWNLVKELSDEFVNKKKKYYETLVIKQFYIPINSIKISFMRPYTDTYDRIEKLWLQIKVSPIYLGHRVKVRITYDNWATFSDMPAEWIRNSYGEEIWEVHLDSTEKVDINFAIFANDIFGNWFWDNNHGNNYVVNYPRKTFSFYWNN